jgi:hypothetical protein
MENTVWKANLEKAKKHFQIADHMAYVTFTLLKENRLIIKILVETAEAVGCLVNSILQKAHSEGRIRIFKTPEENMRVFSEKLSKDYVNKEDLNNILKILEIRKKHIDAHVEFVKKDKFVILLGDKYEALTIEYVKELMASARRLMNETLRKI